jgi:hypothetical protein
MPIVPNPVPEKPGGKSRTDRVQLLIWAAQAVAAVAGAVAAISHLL